MKVGDQSHRLVTIPSLHLVESVEHHEEVTVAAFLVEKGGETLHLVAGTAQVLLRRIG